MDRRKFLKTSALVGSGMIVGGLTNCQSEDQTRLPENANKELSQTGHLNGKSRIVIIRQPAIIDASGKINASKISTLLQTGLRHSYQTDALPEIWRALAQPHDVVGLKVNCLAGKGLSTHPALVQAIIDGLRSAGVPERNIIVWDRLNQDLVRAGFKINVSGSGVKYFGNDVAGYSSDLICAGAIGSLVSRVVTEYCSVLINVPILKDHGIVGISLALKNYYGAIHNPNKYHDHVGDPYVADVNIIPEIRKKTRLTICDALVAQYEGGPPFMPQWTWPFAGLIIGQDMVALDQVGWQIIETQRRERGFKSLSEVGREPSYIATAASPAYRLGTNQLAQMDIVSVEI
ncbi:DUF362 domain-containing protein [candidate division KSB1 bacterium]|nr:DUF362 domain-containing protein [candidate division KSB1 bacterium]